MKRGGGERGQAAVELALALPLVFLALLAVVQVVLVARDQIAVIHAAREGARAAAVAPDVADGVAAAREALPLDLSRASITAVRVGDRVEVRVRYRSPTDVPVVGALLGDVGLDSTASMRLEP
jgi:pilus assembly protein CpaE